MKIEFNSDYKCEAVYTEINKLLRRILKIRNQARNNDAFVYDYDIFVDFNGLKLVLLNILYEKTNIRKVLNENKYYLDSRNLDNAFTDMDSSSEQPLYEKFFLNLNKLFDLETQSFSFLFPFNLDFNYKDYGEYLDNILEVFQIMKMGIDEVNNLLNKVNFDEGEKRYLKSGKYDIRKKFGDIRDELTKEDVLSYLKEYPLILFVEIEAKNSTYAEGLARYIIESFIGFISYSENLLSQRIIYLDNPSGKENFNKIKNDEVVILDKYKVLWPKKHNLNSIIMKIEETPDKFTRYNNLVGLYEKISTIKNKDLLNILRHSFFLYYRASSEEKIEYSFLNFWIIAETLIKSGKAKSDEEVKSVMKYIIGNNILRKRIDYLDKKRNRLVHRGESITIADRDLIKIIVDLLILESTLKMGKLENPKQFGYYLSNIKTKKKDRQNYIDVLKLLNEENKNT